jgi:hypothetical protein
MPVVVKGFKKCCISEAMDRQEEVEEVGNVDSEHDSVSNETKDGNCENNEAETADRNGEYSETGEGRIETGESKKEINSINVMYNMFSNIYFLSHICIRVRN